MSDVPENPSAAAASGVEPILRVEQATFRYGARHALDGVSLSVVPGEIVVLLGPNGAGKTTLVAVACGRLALDQGTVRLNGEDPRRVPSARRALGLVPQELALYPYLTVRENLEVIGRLMGVGKGELRARVVDALAWAGLADRADERSDHLSGGMRRRLNIVASLLHRPQIVLLDEPTVGVDVAGRERIHAMLNRMRNEGLGVVLTTHDLQQAQMLADRVVLMVAGRVKLAGCPRDLVRSVFFDGKELRVSFGAAPSQAAGELLHAEGLSPSSTRTIWNGPVHQDFAEVAVLVEALRKVGAEASEIAVREAGLESLVLHQTGEALPL